MFSDKFMLCNSIRLYFDNFREETFARAKQHLFCGKSSNQIACFCPVRHDSTKQPTHC